MPMPKGFKHSQETKNKISAAIKGTMSGNRNPSWRGGQCLDTNGYVLVLCREHPNAMPNGYVKKHRLVMERHIGRLLASHEHIHHKNGNRTDNRIENLEITDISAHTILHHTNAKRSLITRSRISDALKKAHRRKPRERIRDGSGKFA